MRSSSGIALVSLLLSTGLATALAGCVEDEPGGPGVRPEDGETELPLAGVDDGRPCGDATVADVVTRDGHRLQMCVFDNGLEAFIETSAIGSTHGIRSLPARPACGLDVYLAMTGNDASVPAALLAACPDADPARYAARSVVANAVIDPEAARLTFPAKRTNYCGSGGASLFASSECFQCDPYDDCIDWCVTDLWGWHDRTMSFSNFLGEEGNVAMETNAACTGQVRVKVFDREDVGDAWLTKVDKIIGPGTSSTSGLIYHSVPIFGQDYDFRLRAESHADGGVHRHSGYFLDE